MGINRLSIDTNSYSNFLKGDESSKKLFLEADEIIVSAIVLGELYFGFKWGINENKNLEILNKFLGDSKVKILKINSQTAKIYSNIKHSLKKKGTPIPENDIWIAACAIETNSTLITFDKHFLFIENLKLIGVAKI